MKHTPCTIQGFFLRRESEIIIVLLLFRGTYYHFSFHVARPEKSRPGSTIDKVLQWPVTPFSKGSWSVAVSAAAPSTNTICPHSSLFTRTTHTLNPPSPPSQTQTQYDVKLKSLKCAPIRFLHRSKQPRYIFPKLTGPWTEHGSVQNVQINLGGKSVHSGEGEESARVQYILNVDN